MHAISQYLHDEKFISITTPKIVAAATEGGTELFPIAYFDKEGNFHKPFVLPQEDPLFYRDYRWNFNLPVLVSGKVEIDTAALREFITGSAENVNFDETVETDALSGATWLEKNPDPENSTHAVSEF